MNGLVESIIAGYYLTRTVLSRALALQIRVKILQGKSPPESVAYTAPGGAAT